VRGLAASVLPAGEHGPGAAALVRGETEDMFGLGAREAVLAALVGEDPRGFGAPSPAADLVADLARVTGRPAVVPDEDGVVVVDLVGGERERAALETRVRALAFAHGWRSTTEATGSQALVRMLPVTP